MKIKGVKLIDFRILVVSVWFIDCFNSTDIHLIDTHHSTFQPSENFEVSFLQNLNY